MLKQRGGASSPCLLKALTLEEFAQTFKPAYEKLYETTVKKFMTKAMMSQAAAEAEIKALVSQFRERFEIALPPW